MENPTIPIRYHCRNARLCLQKASFAKKAELVTEELQNLRKFESIVMITLPAHPLYKKADKEVLELEGHLPDAKKRVMELEEVSHIKSPLENVPRPWSIAALQKGLHTTRKQQILESRLSSVDDAMLLQEPLAHSEQMTKHKEKSSESPTMNSAVMPIRMPTSPSHLNRSVKSCILPPGILLGNDNSSNHGNANEELLVRNGTRMNLFESQQQNSSEEKKTREKACPPESTYFYFSKSNGLLHKFDREEDHKISQGVSCNGNGVHESEEPAFCSNEGEVDADSMYSSSTNASMRRAFDSPYDDDTSSQDSQSSDDVLSVESVFSDKGYEWNWVKPVASETDEARLIDQAVPDGNKKGDRPNTQFDGLNIDNELESAAPSNVIFATSDALTVDRGKPLEQRNVEEMYKDSTPGLKMNLFPVKWPNVPFCHTVEEQSDYSDSTLQQKFTASPEQTTFSNPVFDFNPLEGFRISPEVNMLQKLQANKHEG